jgi:signal transduction histidine kinase
VRDLAKLKQAEAEARQAQKLEAVGRLASGVAHELNTPIQFIGDSVSFARDGTADLLRLLNRYRGAVSGVASPELVAQLAAYEDDADLAFLVEELPRAFERTADGVQRVATIVRAMKEFAHPESREKSVADLNRAISSTLTVARNEVKYAAEVETDFGDLPPIACHVGELNQVFLNLLVNAAHAIQDSGKHAGGSLGHIRVVTRADADQVVVSISDDGCGIPEAVRAKIYDPFFTTKAVGRGSGQGLAIARNVVVDKHGGSISIDSQVGVGTTFHVRLPIR